MTRPAAHLSWTCRSARHRRNDPIPSTRAWRQHALLTDLMCAWRGDQRRKSRFKNLTIAEVRLLRISFRLFRNPSHSSRLSCRDPRWGLHQGRRLCPASMRSPPPSHRKLPGSGSTTSCPRFSPPGNAVVWRFRYQRPARRSASWLADKIALPLTGGPTTAVPTWTPAF